MKRHINISKCAKVFSDTDHHRCHCCSATTAAIAHHNKICMGWLHMNGTGNALLSGKFSEFQNQNCGTRLLNNKQRHMYGLVRG